MVAGRPGAAALKPAGVPARDLQWVIMTLDEFEAVRLVDHERLDQDAAAQQMGVSRPTVTRILASARRKLAEALVNGCALRIEGGPVTDASADDACCGRGRGRGHGRCWGGGRRAMSAAVPIQKGAVQNMKVLITASGPDMDANVDPRFGRAAYFIVVDTATGESAAHDNTPNLNLSQGAGIQSARRAAELGADAVVTGRVGPKAFAALSAAGVEIYVDAEGTVKDALAALTAGKLAKADTATAEPHGG